MYCNKTDLAEILGVSERTLTDWQDEGMPIVARGERGQANAYDTVAVITWMEAREIAKARASTPRDRLDLARERLVRIEIADKERKLVPMDEMRRLFDLAVIVWREKLLQLPARFAHLPEVRAFAETAVEEAIAELVPYQAIGSAEGIAEGGTDVCTPGPVSDEARD